MATDAISAISTSSSSASALSDSRKSIADNFDTFLGILTTQLKNQNPLEPLDTNQFTQQLVQFTGVEQQLKTNEYLEALVLGTGSDAMLASSLANQAVNLIGKEVTAGTSSAELKDGEATWTYTIAKDAPASTITISDVSGNIVYSGQHALTAGQGDFVWDGKDQSGLAFDEGTYNISIDAKTAEGTSVTALTQFKGTVDSVDLTGNEPVLMVNGSKVYLDQILSVGSASS